MRGGRIKGQSSSQILARAGTREMGVSCIVIWEPPEGLSIGQALENFLQKRLEILGGRGQGAWSVDCETIQSVPNLVGMGGAQRLANVIHSSEYPRSTFLILENLLCLVAENSLDTVFTHLRSFYPPRKQPRIEVKGKICLVKQYAVKFGAISMGSASKGIVVEVEDKEQTRVSQCWNELTAFTKGLLDSSQPMDVPIFARQSDRVYLPSDSMVHYAFIFEQLRKSPIGPTAAIK